MTGKYTFGKHVAMPFDEALARVTAELAKEGFGVLTEIDVAATLKKRLDKDMPPYRILGACNPQFAHRALEAEPQIGALLPCNVVVRQDAEGKVVVDHGSASRAAAGRAGRNRRDRRRGPRTAATSPERPLTCAPPRRPLPVACARARRTPRT